MIAEHGNVVNYNGDGITTDFPYPFDVHEATDIHLLLTDADGETAEITSGFTVNTITKTVSYPDYPSGQEPAEPPPPVQEGEQLTIYALTPVTQDVDLPNKFPYDRIEAGMDKLTIIEQQNRSTFDRALTLDMSVDTTGMSLKLPNPVPDTILVWNNDGTKLVTTDLKEVTESLTRVATEAAESASASATAANESALSAAESEANASNSASSAATNATTAFNAAIDAASSAADADTSAAHAANSATDADNSASVAIANAQSVIDLADDARGYAQDAADSASAANTSQAGAQGWANLAYTYTEPLKQAMLSSMFEYDANQDLMVVENPLAAASTYWDVDESGDVMPAELEINGGAPDVI